MVLLWVGGDVPGPALPGPVQMRSGVDLPNFASSTDGSLLAVFELTVYMQRRHWTGVFRRVGRRRPRRPAPWLEQVSGLPALRGGVVLWRALVTVNLLPQGLSKRRPWLTDCKPLRVAPVLLRLIWDLLCGRRADAVWPACWSR